MKSGKWLFLSQHGLNVGWKNSSPPTQIIIDTNTLNLRTNIMSNDKQIEQIKQFLYSEICERREYSASRMCEEVIKFIEQMEQENLIIEAIIQRIKDEEKKHSKSIEDWYRIAANKIYATFDIKIKS
jgi:hypothetical protein